MASVATPSRTLSELAELDRAHLIHPNLSGAVEERCVLVRGEGCLLWDADGTEYLDATGGLWLCQIGHGGNSRVRSGRGWNRAMSLPM